MRKILLLACIAFTTAAFPTIRVMTFHHNSPHFIEFQHKCLQKFMVEDYELIVFNDALTVEHEQAIQQACDKFGIRCVRFQQKWHCNHGNGSTRHSQVIQYAMDEYGYDHNDIVIILDGDAFPIRKIDVREMLKDVDVVATGRGSNDRSCVLFWVPFVVFNPQKLPNVRDLHFHPSWINGQVEDSGAAAHHYFQDNPSVKYTTTPSKFTFDLSNYSPLELKEKGYSEAEISLIHGITHTYLAFEMGGYLVHFRETWWEEPEHQARQRIKLGFLSSFLNEILK